MTILSATVLFFVLLELGVVMTISPIYTKAILVFDLYLGTIMDLYINVEIQSR